MRYVIRVSDLATSSGELLLSGAFGFYSSVCYFLRSALRYEVTAAINLPSASEPVINGATKTQSLYSGLSVSESC